MKAWTSILGASVATHEIGHYLLYAYFGFSTITHNAFHEGASDLWSMFVHGSPLIGPNAHASCDHYFRDLSIANHAYPECNTNEYFRGMVLGRAWYDIWCNLGTSACEEQAALETTRDLHIAWLLLTIGDKFAASVCSGVGQSADPLTLVEVLTADDDDANLGNGTPHEAEICAAFAGRGIDPPSGVSVCEESVPIVCPADCDPSTGADVLDIFDYLCFMNAFQCEDTRACDMDISTGVARCDVFDFIAFQSAFSEGCQ
jgi:hypothetical protein